MSFPYGTAGGVIGASLTKSFLPTIFHKLGAEQLTNEEIKIATSQKYPKYYSILYNTLIVLIILIPILLLLLTYFNFDKVQKLFFGRGSIYLSSNLGNFVFSLVNFMGSIFIVGSIIMVMIYFLGSKRLKNYLRKKSIELNGPFKEKPVIKVFISFTVIFYLIISPILISSLLDYTALYPDKMVSNNFFILSSYPLDSISSINFYLWDHDKSDDGKAWSTVASKIVMKDGSEIIQGGVQNERYIELKKAAEKLGLKIILEPPSSSALNHLHNSNEEQQYLYQQIYGYSK